MEEEKNSTNILDLIRKLKEELPQSVTTKEKIDLDFFFKFENIFLFSPSEIHSNLIKFEKENPDLLEIISKNKNSIIVEKKDEIKENLTNFQLIFLKNLLFDILKKDKDEKLRLEFIKFAVEPDIIRLDEGLFSNIKKRIEEISEEIDRLVNWKRSDRDTFESFYPLFTIIRVIITKEKIFQNKRLIMVRKYPLKDDISPSKKSEIEIKIKTFERLFDEKFPSKIGMADKEVEFQNIISELKELEKYVINILKPMSFNYDPQKVMYIFEKYVKIHTILSSKHSLLGDFPINIPKSSGTSDFEGRGYFKREDIETLLNDIKYCIGLLESRLGEINTEPLLLNNELIKCLLEIYSKDAEFQNIIIDKPWLIGIIDNLLVSKTIFHFEKIKTRYRIALILTDEALEFAFKNFITKVKKFDLPEKDAKYRDNLHKMVKKHSSFSEDQWTKITHYYGLRCDLYHEESEKTITDTDYQNYNELVLNVISDLFLLSNTNFRQQLNLNLVERSIDVDTELLKPEYKKTPIKETKEQGSEKIQRRKIHFNELCKSLEGWENILLGRDKKKSIYANDLTIEVNVLGEILFERGELTMKAPSDPKIEYYSAIEEHLRSGYREIWDYWGNLKVENLEFYENCYKFVQNIINEFERVLKIPSFNGFRKIPEIYWCSNITCYIIYSKLISYSALTSKGQVEEKPLINFRIKTIDLTNSIGKVEEFFELEIVNGFGYGSLIHSNNREDINTMSKKIDEIIKSDIFIKEAQKIYSAKVGIKENINNFINQIANLIKIIKNGQDLDGTCIYCQNLS